MEHEEREEDDIRPRGMVGLRRQTMKIKCESCKHCSVFQVRYRLLLIKEWYVECDKFDEHYYSSIITECSGYEKKEE